MGVRSINFRVLGVIEEVQVFAAYKWFGVVSRELNKLGDVFFMGRRAGS